MIPATGDLPIQYAGDTFDTAVCTATQTDSEDVTTPVDLTDVAIKIQFRTKNYTSVFKTFTIDNGITVTDAENGIFEIDEFINGSAGTYLYDIQFTYPDGKVRTYAKGKYIVISDTTR